jgi:hypothetical protein
MLAAKRDLAVKAWTLDDLCGMHRVFMDTSRSLQSLQVSRGEESPPERWLQAGLPAPLRLLYDHGEKALFPEAGKRQAVAATDAGLFEDVFEVDLDGSRLDAEAGPDLLILHAAFD